MKIAFPSEHPGGMQAALSDHFGHCAVFTLVDVDGDKVENVDTLANGGHEQGGCMAPVMLLKNAGVEVLVAGGMGPRPLAGFQQVGIEVYFNEGAAKVEDAIELLLAGSARRFGPAHVCGGGGGGHHGGQCGGHDHG
jgi:predicted Fe-Mo cluster-binding NifX family protein